MKIAVALLIMFLAGCAASHPVIDANESPLVTGFPQLPTDARDVAERLASCSHFWGEIGGDSERDKEIMGFLAELGCGTIEQEVAAIRSKYADSKTVQKALNQAGNL
jgi:hypothetical protein